MKKIDLAGIFYVILSITDNCIKVKREGDEEVLTIWKSNPFFNVFMYVYHYKARSC